MATYYIDPTNGNDADDGLSWANAFLTLNGAEDEPVAAGDLVWVGPGVYRELLTVDISGAGGSEIVYVGDVTGEHTDGVGGIVRVTGSDNDQTSARNNIVVANDKDYRIFRGFWFDMATQEATDATGGCHHWTVEDCAFSCNATHVIYCDGAGQSDWNILRCVFLSGVVDRYDILFQDDAGAANAGHLVQNCVHIGFGRAIGSIEVGGLTVRNTFFRAKQYGVRIATALPGGYTVVTVENCILANCTVALRSVNLGELVENFNTLFQNTTARTNVAVGGNSETYPPLILPPLLHSGASQVSGFQFPWWFGELSEWSPVRAITGNNEPSVDLYGIARPATASKNSWGAVQFHDMEIETGTVQAGTYSRALHDAGSVLVRRVPVTGAEITVTLYMRFEADYEPDPASLPWMVIKQPGQADRTTVMTVAANNWEQLTDTFTPASPPGFIEVWAESRNTAGAGAYEVFWDTMDVS